MERIRHIEYKGKEIIYFNYQGLVEDQEVIDFANEAAEYIKKLGRPTLQLSDVTGIFFTPAVTRFISDKAGEVKPFILKDAVLGIKGIKRVLFQIYETILGDNARAFANEQDAKEWLVK